MVPSAAGAVVLITFPFSDLSRTKLRPALALADAGRNDWILCQITSSAYADPRAVLIQISDFASGSLNVASFARPGKLFTAHESLMTSEVGLLSASAFGRVVDSVVALLRPPAPATGAAP